MAGWVDCSRCGGSGSVRTGSQISEFYSTSCPLCHGSGGFGDRSTSSRHTDNSNLGFGVLLFAAAGGGVYWLHLTFQNWWIVGSISVVVLIIFTMLVLYFRTDTGFKVLRHIVLAATLVGSVWLISELWNEVQQTGHLIMLGTFAILAASVAIQLRDDFFPQLRFWAWIFGKGKKYN